MTTFLSEEESKPEVEETTDQIAPTDESNTDESPLSEEPKTHDSEDEGEEDSQFDYQAELERERQLRLKAEKKIVKLKKQMSSGDDDNDVSEDREERIAQKVVGYLESKSNREVVEEVLDRASNGNAGLRELIKFHYENTINHSGSSRQSIEEDIAAARAIANRRRYENESRALKDTLQSKATLSTAPQFSGQKISQNKPQPKLSEKERKLLQWSEKFKKSK